jgi:hypothetical protein
MLSGRWIYIIGQLQLLDESLIMFLIRLNLCHLIAISGASETALQYPSGRQARAAPRPEPTIPDGKARALRF